MSARALRPLLFASLIVTLATGCADEHGGTAASPATGSGGAAELETIDPATAHATISGHVGYEGAVPDRRPIRMNADPYCAEANREAAAEPPFEVGPQGALAEVLVYVSKGLEKYRFDVPQAPVLLDQRSCRYHPHVFAIRAGQPLEIRNSDGTLHNVHAVPHRNDGFNIGMPTTGMTVVRSFTRPEVFVRIKCDVHPWMAAFAGVVGSPYFALTGPDGSYRIEGLPPGRYTVEAVHPLLGGQVAQVSVGEAGAGNVDFTFSD